MLSNLMRYFVSHAILLQLSICIHLTHAWYNNSPYDQSITLFSKDGQLHQVEYARLAGLKGNCVICGVDSSNTEILLCFKTDKHSYQLIDRSHVDKIMRIDDHIFLSFAGLAGDGRVLVNHARKFCIDHMSLYGMKPSIHQVATWIGELQHRNTLFGGKRPYGVQTLILGWDPSAGEMQVYKTEPSGIVDKYRAVAIGKYSDKLIEKLEAYSYKLDGSNMVQMFAKLIARTTSAVEVISSLDEQQIDIISIRRSDKNLHVYHEYIDNLRLHAEF